MLLDHRSLPADRDREASGHRPQNLAVLPPHFENALVGVPLVHEAVEAGVQRAVSRDVGEIHLFHLDLKSRQLVYIRVGHDIHEPPGEIGLDQQLDLVGIAQEGLVDRAHARPAIRADDHEAFSAKLLQGFYPPTDGQILLDGRDIRHLAANELRQTYGVVPQETVLFAGTIYDNLVMAHPHAGFDDVIKAAKLAEIHEVIEQLPQGYQTVIGEHGVGLSGGQRQRLAIARALLKRPKVLIFDEAVSSLDQQTAEHFAQTINRLKGQATMLFITHQIPKGLQVDEVFSFGGRAVAEQTPPTEIKTEGGLE